MTVEGDCLATLIRSERGMEDERTGQFNSLPSSAAAQTIGKMATLPSFEDDLEAAKQHSKAASCADGDGKPWPIVATDPASLGVYGVGIELYFQFTRTAVALFAIGTLLVAPLLLLNVTGSTLQAHTASGSILSWLAITTIGNLGTPTTMPNSTAASRFVEAFGKQYDIRTVTFVAGSLDALMTFLLFVAFLWFEFVCIPMVINAHERTRVTPEAFTVAVTKLPKRLPGHHSEYAAQLGWHFEALLRAQVTEYNAVRGLLVVRASDEGSPNHLVCAWLLPLGFNGRDLRGRKLGRITSINGAECSVKWHSGKVTTCFIGASTEDKHGELLDARLLARLENHGCFAMQTPQTDEMIVQSVNLVRDFGGRLSHFRREAQQMMRQKEERRAATIKEAVDVEALPLEEDASEKQAPLSLGDVADHDVIAAFVTFNYVRHRDFVYREHVLSRSCLWQLQPRRLQFHGNALQVEEAPAPSDIFWENLDFPESSRRSRRRLALLICVVLLLVCGVLFSAAKQTAKAVQSHGGVVPCGVSNTTSTANTTVVPSEIVDCSCQSAGYRQVLSDVPKGIYDRCRPWLVGRIEAAAATAAAAAAAVVVNVAATPAVVRIADVERPRTLTTRSHRVMSMVFLVQFINIGFIAAFVHLKLDVHILGDGVLGLLGNGSFTDFAFGWYVIVGTSLLLTMSLNALCPLLGVLWTWSLSLYRWYALRRLRSKGHVQSELMELHTPPQFELAVQHAQQLCAIFVTMIFSAGMPLLLPLLLVCMSLFYWSDKYVLLRGSRIPPRYKHDLIVWVLRLVPIALLMHCMVAVWVFGNTDVAPSYQTHDAALEQNAKSYIDNSFLKAAFHRMFAASSLPNTIVGAIIGVLVMWRLTNFLIGLGIGNGLGVLRVLFCTRAPPPTWGRSYALSRAFSDEPMEEMKRLKVVHSYDIADMPEYRFLSTRTSETLIQDSTGRSGGNTTPSAMLLAVLGDAKEVSPRSKEEKASLVETAHGPCDQTATVKLATSEGFSDQTPTLQSRLPSSAPPTTAGSSTGDESSQMSDKESSLHPIALKFAPELLDCTISSQEWADELVVFFRTNCPRFRNFDPDAELEVVMTAVHEEFCSKFESLMVARLREMGLDVDTFSEILAKRSGKTMQDTTVRGLLEKIDRYTDFCEFGKLMQRKFYEFHPEATPPVTITQRLLLPKRSLDVVASSDVVKHGHGSQRTLAKASSPGRKSESPSSIDIDVLVPSANGKPAQASKPSPHLAEGEQADGDHARCEKQILSVDLE